MSVVEELAASLAGLGDEIRRLFRRLATTVAEADGEVQRQIQRLVERLRAADARTADGQQLIEAHPSNSQLADMTLKEKVKHPHVVTTRLEEQVISR